jgi:hypothetical protein
MQQLRLRSERKTQRLPNKVDMGIYILNYITMLKYNLRGPIRREQEFLLSHNDLDISVKGINEALLRVGDACKSEYTAMGIGYADRNMFT